MIRFVFGALARFVPEDRQSEAVLVDGVPGLLAQTGGRPIAVLTADVRDGQIQTLYIITNPDKIPRE